MCASGSSAWTTDVVAAWSRGLPVSQSVSLPGLRWLRSRSFCQTNLSGFRTVITLETSRGRTRGLLAYTWHLGEKDCRVKPETLNGQAGTRTPKTVKTCAPMIGDSSSLVRRFGLTWPLLDLRSMGLVSMRQETMDPNLSLGQRASSGHTYSRSTTTAY